MMMNQAFQKHGEPASAGCGKLRVVRLLFTFMVIMMAAGTSMADSISPCSVDSVPIQIMEGAELKVIRVGDELQIMRGEKLDTIDTITTLSAATIYDYPPGFAAFVTAVTEHVAAKLAQEKLCLDNAESQKRSILQFVPLNIRDPIGLRPLAAAPPLGAIPSGGGCRISSPWIDLVIERKPIPWVRGFIRWSARQLLADQAVLTGAQNVPPGVAVPFRENEFKQYVFDYSRTIQYVGATEKLIEEQRVPPDLLWLFIRAWQGTSSPFFNVATGAMEKAMIKGSDGYTRIVIMLIDCCFASDGADMTYRNIFDINDPILLEQYKITTSIYD